MECWYDSFTYICFHFSSDKTAVAGEFTALTWWVSWHFFIVVVNYWKQDHFILLKRFLFFFNMLIKLIICQRMIEFFFDYIQQHCLTWTGVYLSCSRSPTLSWFGQNQSLKSLKNSHDIRDIIFSSSRVLQVFSAIINRVLNWGGGVSGGV